MNFRPTAWLRTAHEEGRCPEDCPHCARIDQAQDRGCDDRDYLIRNEPEGWAEP